MSARRTRVLLALGQSGWEAQFVARVVTDLANFDVHRCVDVSNLILEAKLDDVGVAVIDAQFPRLDSTVVATLNQGRARVVGAASDAEGADRLAALGVSQVVRVVGSDIGPAIGELRELCADSTASSVADVRSQVSSGPAHRTTHGALVAVWGPPGAPGRTSIALAIAQLSAAAGTETLLVDADSVSPGVGPALCLESDGSGLIAAAHHGDRGTLDEAVLARLARGIDPRFRVLTGVSHVSRRAELRAAAMAKVWQVATQLSQQCVVDVGGCVDDGSLAFDADVADFGLNSGGHTAAATALTAADELIAVTTCEPAALARLLSHLAPIRSLAPAARLHVVVNRVRSPLVRNSAAGDELRAFVMAQTRAASVTLVSEDRAVFDHAIVNGLTPFEHDRKSPFIGDLSVLSRDLLSPLLVSA